MTVSDCTSLTTDCSFILFLAIFKEQEVIGRIEASIEDPLALENAGHALYDMYPQRRGNLFSDEVYRLVKASDASDPEMTVNCKFSKNDVVTVTLQPMGSGDVFHPKNLPTSETAIMTESRVIATGPTYVDIAIPAGKFEATFGPAPNNYGPTGKGCEQLRLRLDRFFSETPYKRMVEALTKMSSIPERGEQFKMKSEADPDETRCPKTKSWDAAVNGRGRNPHSTICMDEVLREVIISTHAFTDPSTPLFHDVDACDLQSLSRLLAKPPMPTSIKMANQVLTYVQANKGVFKELNEPQLAAVEAALTRKLTMIQGPPGTGKVCFHIDVS